MENKIFGMMEKMYMEMQKGFEKVNRDIARLEHDHGEKLAALFDEQKAMREILDDHSVRLSEVNKTLDDHSVQLSEVNKTLNDHSVQLSEVNETLDDHTGRLSRIESKLETHDIKIHVLDKTKANAE
ncbi:MAG: hypothetical protein GX318_01720 [Clostridia bacterium]|nr:hypothetical protein [Clostridia bacterium]